MNIENEYYQAKAAKEDNPESAIAGFERVGPCQFMVCVCVCTPILSVVCAFVGTGVGGQKGGVGI